MPVNSGPDSASTYRAAGRAAGRGLAKNRYLRASLAAVRATSGHFYAIGRRLGLELSGFFFLVFAAIGALAARREYLAYAAGDAAFNRTVVAVLFTATFFYFGMTSLLRARKQGRP